MFKYSVVFALCFLATVYSYPANDKKDEVEQVDFVPLQRHRPQFPFDFDDTFGREPVVDTGYFPNPFGFKNYLGDVLRQMNDRLSNIFRRLHDLNGTETGIDGNGIHISGVDLSKAKNTSVVEVVNGHKVTVNKTQYDNDDENVHFHVQVINVAPLDDDLPTNPNAEDITESSRDRETVEETDNEISKSREMYNYDIETLDETDNYNNIKPSVEWNEIEPLEDVEQNNQIVDLSNDINVNKYMADAGAKINPDAELLDDIDFELLQKKKSRNY